MPSRFIAITACLLAASLLRAQPERRIRASQQPVRATDPEVLKAAGIDQSLIDAAQFRILSQLSDTGLRAILDGADPAAVKALNGQTLDQVIQAAIGDLDEQLVYKPLTPCRLIDTRNAGGIFTAGETRHYDLIGPSNYSAYGGNAAGCGIPNAYVSAPGVFMRGNRVRALILNLTSVGPVGMGYLIAWPTNLTVPNASMLNYGNDFALANGVTARTCTSSCSYFANPTCNPCPSGDLSIRNASGTTHVLVDVLGYMEPAELPTGSEGISEFMSISSNACRFIASCVATNDSSFSKGVTVIGHVNLYLAHHSGTDSTFMVTLGTESAVCGSPNITDAGEGKFMFASAFPSSPAQGTATASKRFTIAPHASVTYYLNGQNISGAAGDDYVDGASIQCIVNQ